MEQEENEGQGGNNLQRLREYWRILQNLLNSHENESDDEIDQFEDNSVQVKSDEIKQKVKELLDQPIAQAIVRDCGNASSNKIQTVGRCLMERECGIKRNNFCPRSQNIQISQRYIPRNSRLLEQYRSQVFCGQFSKDGEIYMSACQDRKIRIYNTFTWKKVKEIIARDVGWSIISTDYSPDQRWIIYSSWSDAIRMANIHGEHEVHETLDIKPSTDRFCLFSIQFSSDSNEILCGSSDRHIYIYDLNRREVSIKILAHNDDINTACYLETSNNNLIVSGSDDRLCKVWDRRTIEKGIPAGIMIGHLEGITHTYSKNDGRYFISNGKDQCIKLWDIRKMATSNSESIKVPKSTGWDYRYGNYGFGRNNISSNNASSHPNDQSLMTYRGHQVLQTLIRAYFSPMESTGQKFIYSGSYNGSVYVYDVLSGDIVQQISGHQSTVRDVSWHPHLPLIASASWDGCVNLSTN